MSEDKDCQESQKFLKKAIKKHKQLSEANGGKKETLTVENVTARCEVESCDWEATDSLDIFPKTGDPVISELVEKCLQHHNKNRPPKDYLPSHNRFELFYQDEKRGFLSASSAAITGYFKLQK